MGSSVVGLVVNAAVHAQLEQRKGKGDQEQKPGKRGSVADPEVCEGRVVNVVLEESCGTSRYDACDNERLTEQLEAAHKSAKTEEEQVWSEHWESEKAKLLPRARPFDGGNVLEIGRDAL
jgi:hypothetical protein